MVVVKYVYDAWGNHWAYDGNGTQLSGSRYNIINPKRLCDINPFRYRGYFYDAETGLYYLKSRYYDPSIGRFISMDKVSYADPSTVDGLNLYAYCNNNPVKNVDPTGHFVISILGAILGTLLVVGCIAATANDIYQVVQIENNFDKRTQISDDNVRIIDSYKVITPWVKLGYSTYLNYFKEETKDIIKGSSVGFALEWDFHNLAYYGLSLVDGVTGIFGKHFDKIGSLLNATRSVDAGKTMFSDKHGGLSCVMWGVYFFSNPITFVYDLIRHFI